MKLHLHIWRQKDPADTGRMADYEVDVSPDCSFLEMLDLLNERLIREGKEEPIAFDYDCREGVCGTCGVVVNGFPHGPVRGATTCQVHMRNYSEGDHLYIEPFRAKSFPVIKDLVVDRGAFDRIIQKAGFISCNTGGAPDGNAVPISHTVAEAAMDAAACIGCGACVAACKNASAMLFVSAKMAHLGMLPQGEPERLPRAKAMVEQHDHEGFGSCTNQYECEAVCPKEIGVKHIAMLNRDYAKATLAGTK